VGSRADPCRDIIVRPPSVQIVFMDVDTDIVRAMKGVKEGTNILDEMPADGET